MRFRKAAVLLVAGLVGYLLAWPVSITPLAWTPPKAPPAEGVWAPNERLLGIQRLLDGAGTGPESVAALPDGRIVTGFDDGRVVSMAPDGSDCRVLANTAGRPLGVAAAADGSVLVADALRGLMRIAPDRTLDELASKADGIRLGFPDDLDIDASGRVYFSDASWKFGYGHHLEDTLEHGPRGRLLRYDPASHRTDTLMAELHFANGIALGPGQRYVLINETTEYKVTRFWLLGDQAGTSEPFAENLPGFPDNITFNGRDRFWVALFAPRDAMLDALLPHPFLRSMVARLPPWTQPAPKRHSFIVGLDLEGHVAEQYQYGGEGAYAPITSVRESGGYLVLGSLTEGAVGRIALDVLRGTGSVEAPPAPVKGQCVASIGEAHPPSRPDE